MAEGKHTLWIEEIGGKFYLTTAKWPESFDATQAWLTGLNPRTTKWDGNKLSLWLENGNAIYVVGDGFRPDAPAVTLHLMYGPDPGPVPGRETTPELTAANKAKVDDALKKMGELMGASTTTPDIIRVGTPGVWRADAAPASSLTKALMTASTPKMNLLGLTGPVPGANGIDSDTLAQKIVAVPGFLDTIYARFSAEQQIRQATSGLNATLSSGTAGFYGYMQPVQATQPRSTWSDFLTDVAAFLTTIAEASEVFAMTKDLPRTVVVQDELGMAGMGRLAESSGFERSKPRNYAVRDFFSQEAMVARSLVNRARTLQGVAPEKPEVVRGGTADDPTDEDDALDGVSREYRVRDGTMGGNGEMGGQRE